MGERDKEEIIKGVEEEEGEEGWRGKEKWMSEEGRPPRLDSLQRA